MKNIFISFLLFTLVVGLVIVMDIIQGHGVDESVRGFIKIKQKMTGEDFFLLSLFFLPLLYARFYKNVKNNQ